MNNFFKAASNWLEEFPQLRQFLLRLYGIVPFSPDKIQYRKRSGLLKEEISFSTSFDVIFDAQCLQTLTRQRGIGRYSISLIEAMCKFAPDMKFAAYFTNIVDRAQIDTAKSLLVSLHCPNLSILVFDPFEKSSKISFAQSQEFLKASLSALAPKIVISLSNFEKPNTVIPLPPSPVYKTSAILYDLIPLQFSDQLLISNRQRSTYRWLVMNLQKYNNLMSISKTTKANWENLVSNSTSIKVIGGAGQGLSEQENLGYFDRFGILCIGAEQKHKNVERLIGAYSSLPKSVQAVHQLTIVGIRSSGARKRLSKLARRRTCALELPEYLSDEDLGGLYQTNRILVMPSLSEGLSLPVLEAWANGLPAIGSTGTVADELIREKSLLFDPLDPAAIAQTIEKLLFSKDEWEKAILHSRAMARNYTWENTAILALSAIAELIKND